MGNWIKSYLDFEGLHLEIFGICGHFMKNGKCWILLDNPKRLQKMCPTIWNLRIPKQKKLQFIRNQYHLAAFGEDQYIALLFFNRELNCLVAVEIKRGKFKTSYLGQLQGYLSILDGFECKLHENTAIGIILCKDMNKSFVNYVIQDYTKPMGEATYKTSKDMSEELQKALPDIDDLKKLLDENEE